MENLSFTAESFDEFQNFSNIICYFRGKTHGELDALSCFFYQLPYFLEDIKFAYITLFLLIIILLVSIFGDIKESYRWFILNQTFWDLFIIYDSICNTPPNGSDGIKPTCFYSLNNKSEYSFLLKFISLIFGNIALNAMYTPLFLLIFSRFLTMYFNRFYGHFSSKPRNLFFLIFGFQLFYLLILNIPDWADFISSINDERGKEICAWLLCSPEDLANEECNFEKYNQCIEDFGQPTKWLLVTLHNIKYFIAPILLLTANILAIFVIIKVGSQFKFQAKNNRKNLMTSIKITVVITFQCIFLTFLCFISLHENYVNNLQRIIGFSFPSWFVYLSRNYTIQWFCVIRIFCDSIIMLIILTEYRRNIINFIVFIFYLCVKPKYASRQFTSKFTRSTMVTVISTTQTSEKSKVTKFR